MIKTFLTLISAIFLSTAVSADVEMARYASSNGREINVLKGLGPVPKISKTTLPKLEIGQYAPSQKNKKSYLSCETRSGQKFSDGDFGYAGCLNEKKDQAKMQGVSPPLADGAGPSLENLRINLDHIIKF